MKDLKRSPTRWRPYLRAVAFAAVASGGIASATAATSPWVKSDHVEARLVTAVSGTGDLATMPAGVEVKLDGDWKTYWRSPGDAGLPPTLDWNGSANLASATLLYPAPERVTVLGIQTFGYKHDVLFPVDVALAEKGKPLDLKLKLDILICAEQCIPKSIDLALSVPAGPATPDAADAQALAKARAAVPTDSRTTGLSVKSVQEVSDKGEPALQVVATAQVPFDKPDVIAEVKPDVALGTPKVALSADRTQATFLVPLQRHLPVGAHLAGRDVTLTVTDGPRALEDRAGAITRGTSAAEEAPGPSLLAMIGVALLGGLILNLMPCVLPVLSIKFISVVSQGGRAPGAVRAGFLATAAGIVVSFLAIAGALIAVKAAGHSIGWGLQFQQPGFIAAMAVLVTVFACHLAGLFEVPLPRFIANAASARNTGPDESLAGHFVTGAFATLLATPCSAPFLGTAVGFALSGSVAEMLAIFLALGIGLALPYLAVAAVPSLATRMPRPGRWMLRVKQIMAVPLALTALWLLAILAAQVGVAAAAMLAGLLVALVILFLLRERLPEARRGLVFPAALVVALVAVVLPGVMAAQERSGAAAEDDIAWKTFDQNKIRSLVSQGKTVFVDVTADWCLTCQANKRFVLSKTAIAKRLNDSTVPMKADWTRPDPAIGAYLAGYGRYGIPFNIVYGPGAPGGIALPELLTPGDVAAALDKASGLKSSGLVPSATFAALGAGSSIHLTDTHP